MGASASYNQTVDKRIIEKIYDLVSRGITRPDEVRRCIDEGPMLETLDYTIRIGSIPTFLYFDLYLYSAYAAHFVYYVERDLLSTIPAAARPRKSNRKYYPTRQDLRNHITKAISAHKYSKDDQESLKTKVQEWEKQGYGKLFYRPRSSQHTDEKASIDKFLFVQQEKWQQNLLRRYGSNLVLMDATYKTTKYALPLFFVFVHCNIGYKVVASFICQNEDADSISEALSYHQVMEHLVESIIFHGGFFRCRINAIEQQFPNSQVYICDFHRIQAWQRWSRTGKNGLTAGQQEAFLAMLQRVAYSRSKKQFEEALVTLRNSKVYRNNMKAKDYVDAVCKALGTCLSEPRGCKYREYKQWFNQFTQLFTQLLLCLSSVSFQIHTNTISKLTSNRAVCTGNTEVTSRSICTTDQAISLKPLHEE